MAVVVRIEVEETVKGRVLDSALFSVESALHEGILRRFVEAAHKKYQEMIASEDGPPPTVGQ